MDQAHSTQSVQNANLHLQQCHLQLLGKVSRLFHRYYSCLQSQKPNFHLFATENCLISMKCWLAKSAGAIHLKVFGQVCSVWIRYCIIFLLSFLCRLYQQKQFLIFCWQLSFWMVRTLTKSTLAKLCRCFHAGQQFHVSLVLLAFDKFKENSLSLSPSL